MTGLAGLLLTSATGAKAQWMPRARASRAVTSPVKRAASSERVAPIAIANGQRHDPAADAERHAALQVGGHQQRDVGGRLQLVERAAAASRPRTRRRPRRPRPARGPRSRSGGLRRSAGCDTGPRPAPRSSAPAFSARSRRWQRRRAPSGTTARRRDAAAALWRAPGRDSRRGAARARRRLSRASFMRPAEPAGPRRAREGLLAQPLRSSGPERLVGEQHDARGP